MDSLDELRGKNGCQFIDGTASVSGNWYGFVANEDTVVATLTSTINDATGQDDLTNIGLASKTIGKGIYIASNENKPSDGFTTIALTSGSIIAYKK